MIQETFNLLEKMEIDRKHGKNSREAIPRLVARRSGPPKRDPNAEPGVTLGSEVSTEGRDNSSPNHITTLALTAKRSIRSTNH